MSKFQHGNQLWKNRSKHGRDTLFATPELLWDAAKEYFQWCDENPLKDTRAFGQAWVQRPYTKSGLCQFLNCNSKYFDNFKEHASDDFNYIISDIEQTIFTQKFELASIGVFKENLIARELGISDKIKNEHSGQIKQGDVDFSDMSAEELESLSKVIEKLNAH